MPGSSPLLVFQCLGRVWVSVPPSPEPWAVLVSEGDCWQIEADEGIQSSLLKDADRKSLCLSQLCYKLGGWEWKNKGAPAIKARWRDSTEMFCKALHIRKGSTRPTHQHQGSTVQQKQNVSHKGKPWVWHFLNSIKKQEQLILTIFFSDFPGWAYG